MNYEVAQSAIGQLHARCADAVWRMDIDAFADCYAEDGEWKIVGLHFRGRAEIAAGLGQLLSRNHRVLLTLGTPLLQLGDGEAAGRTMVRELIKRRDGTGASTVGIYHERFVYRDGHWLFRWRHFDLHYLGPVDLGEAFAASADYGPAPAMPAEDGPTVFPAL